MVETDEFINQLDKVEATKQPPKTSIQSLISLERSQKLDLLIHLISNLHQSLVLCGPEEIGKTTLLNILQQRKVDSWHICRIEATPNLSFERVHQLIVDSIKQDYPELKHYDLAEMLDHFEKSNLKLVVAMDDSGELVPGMITTLCQFAVANPVLRIVFVLTQDELHIKKSSDKAIDDCHFIEMPPLTEKQCGEFLQNLSGKPDAVVPFNAISPAMVEKIYQETHGIPGKIMTILPNLSNYVPVSTSKWVLSSVIVVVLLVGVAGFYMWNSSFVDQPVIITHTTNEKTILSAGINQISDLHEAKEVVARAKSKRPLKKQFPKEIVINPDKLDQQPVKAAEEKAVQIQSAVVDTQTVVAEENRNGLAMPWEEIGEDSSIRKELVAEKPSEPAVEKKSSDFNEIILKEKDVEIVVKQPAINDSVVEQEKVEVAVSEDINNLQEEKQPASADVEKKAIELKQSEAPSIAGQEAVIEKPLSKPETSSTSTKEQDVIKLAHQNDDAGWVISQPPRNYTLQLMVLSSHDSAKKLLRKYSQLEYALKYLILQGKNKQRYIILYGSFASTAQARKAQKSLPQALQKIWMRRFSGLQKKIKN